MVWHGIKVPSEVEFFVNKVGAVVAIAAGKGGVGKSLVTVQLARFLAARGSRVGILDADLYGPSIGKMMREDRGDCARGKGDHSGEL